MSGKVSALGRRITNSVLYRTGLRRDAPAPPPLPPPEPRWVRVEGGPLQGHELLLDPDSPAYWEREMMEGRFDPFIYETAAGLGPLEGKTFWDVGAHIGYHSLCFAAMVGERGRVVSFEPNPYNLERFRAHLARNPGLASRVTLHTSAVSDADGESSFSFSPNVDDGTSSGSHLVEAVVPEHPSAYAAFDETPVETVRIDTLLREGRAPAPDIIKIDTEGAEYLVLQGAREALSTIRPFLFVEVHNITLMLRVQQLMFDLNYKVTLLDAEHASTSRCFISAEPGG